MSPDIPRLESGMLSTIGDPGLTDIFKALRTYTGERQVFQNVADKDIGDRIPHAMVSELEKHNPNLFGASEDDIDKE